MIYKITQEKEGLLVRDIISGELGISRSLLKKLKFSESGIKLNGEQVTVRRIVRAGDILELATEDTETPAGLVPKKIELEIIFEDDAVVIPNKPPYMPTHQSHGHYDDTLANALAYRYADRGLPFVFRPVNRLDRNTSGLVLIARSKLSAASLSESMRRGDIEKTYLAILDGSLPADEGVIETHIRRRESSIIFREVCKADAEGAAHAVTTYKKLAESGGLTLVSAKPLTGRTHQLRVHFAHLGAPIVGDDLYGVSSELIGRHALHASELTFPHPDKKSRDDSVKTIKVTAPIPEDMLTVLEGFGFDISTLKL